MAWSGQAVAAVAGRGLNEWLGVAARTCSPGGRVPEPSPHDRCAERGVEQDKDPWRRLVEEQSLEPVLNEAGTDALLSSTGAEPVLKGCERASDTQPRLCDDDTDCREMQQAEGEGVHPNPAGEVADDNQDQASHDEEDDREVKRKNEVREEGVHAAILDCDA